MPRLTFRNTTKPTLDAHDFCEVDVARLIKYRAVVAAASGAGKSWLIRRILEQTFGLVQQFVFDPEGEYHTLREKFAYVLGGPDGEFPLTIEDAPKLALRLLELRVSVIFDLSELGDARDVWLAGFLGGLMNAPRKLWHPIMCVIDECHRFCPEQGAGVAASTSAVKWLATAGRKRGLALLAGVQRYAELHKTVAAELNNKLYGRMDLENDIDKARKRLGMTSAEAHKVLPNLQDGEFFAVGRAFTHYDDEHPDGHHGIARIRTGPVSTTHPEPGMGPLPPTPTPAEVKSILGQLAELPKKLEAETPVQGFPAHELTKVNAERDQLRGVIVELRAKLTTEYATGAEYQRLWAQTSTELANAKETLQKIANLAEVRIGQIEDALKVPTPIPVTMAQAERTGPFPMEILENSPPEEVAAIVSARKPKRKDVIAVVNEADDNRGMSAMERASLIAVAMFAELGCTQGMIRLLTGYAPSGKLGAAWANLRRNGWVIQDDHYVKITAEGEKALGKYTPHRMGKALREHLLNTLPAMEREILREACGVFPEVMTFEQFRVRSGYAPSGKLGAAKKWLIDRGYLTKPADDPAAMKASAVLFDRNETGERPRTNADIRKRLLNQETTPLPDMERKLLAAACAVYPESIDFAAAREATGYAPSGKLGSAWKALRDASYLKQVAKGRFQVTPELF